MAHKYNKTVGCVMGWAQSELEHVGRIVSMEDKDLQYSYALSTVNGMAHLRDALFELVNNPEVPANHKRELLITHDAVIRAMKHLVADFNVNLDTIRAFNTRKVLSNLSYLNGTNNKSRKNRNRKNNRKNNTRRN